MTSHFPVHRFAEHADTLPTWWRQGRSNRTVVYLDAHLDLQQTAPGNIEALKNCDNVEQVIALESPHHLNPSQCYAYGIEDFLYPAFRLGLIKRLIWVAPPHIPKRYSRSLIDYVQQMDGIGFEELTGFVPAGGDAIRGTLLGLDITVCGFDDLGELGIGADYDLDVDIDYFVEVPGDRLWTDPATVIQRITDQLATPRLATISCAVSSAFTPMAYGFVGDYVHALLTRDETKCEHFGALYEIASSLGGEDRDKAASRGRGLLDRQSGCAHSRYLMSLLDDDADRARQLREAAASLDPSYGFDVSRDASAYPNRRIPLRRSALERLMESLSMESDAMRRGLAELAVAKLCAVSGRVADAERLARRQSGELAEPGDLALDIARAHLAGHSPGQAIEWLEIAGRGEKTRTVATLYLGDLDFHAGRPGEALERYRQVAQRAPAWMLPLERQRDCLRALNDRDALAQVQDLIARRQRVITGLLRADA